MNTFTEGWYLIYTKPRHEKKVAEQLSKLEIESFLPATKTERKWCDRKKVVTSPLFPSYVFVKLGGIGNYIASLDVDGVLYFVRAGKKIAKVYEHVITDLKLLVHNSREVEISTDSIHTGERMLITDGPFTGFHCEVVNHMGHRKILVRVDLLQRNIMVKLNCNDLAPCNEYNPDAISV
jgi:transcription elongation factor/antiterminator RfaH